MELAATHARNTFQAKGDRVGVCTEPRGVRVSRRRHADGHRQKAINLKPRIDRCEVPEAPGEKSGAGEQDRGERDLRHGQRHAHAMAGRTRAALRAPFLHPAQKVSAGELERRWQTRQDAGERCRRRHVQHHIRIDVDPLRLRKVGAGQRRQRSHARVREQEPDSASHSCDDQVLGKQALSDPPPRRAKRRHDRDLAAASKRPRQHQVRHVRAGDQEDQTDRHGQRLKRRPNRRDELLLQGTEHDTLRHIGQ